MSKEEGIEATGAPAVEPANVEPEQLHESSDVEMSTSKVCNKEVSRSALNKFKQKLPRFYYILTQIVLPLSTLIALCFLFGRSLAKLEMKGEIESNDEALHKVFESYSNHTADRRRIWTTMANASVQCLVNDSEALLEALPNPSTVVENMENCSFMKGRFQFPRMEALLYLVESKPELSFNWMKCYQESDRRYNGLTADDHMPLFGLNPENNHDQQWIRYVFRFGRAIEDIVNKDYQGMRIAQILNDSDRWASVRGTGSEGCQVHTAGGALFWFTIMTTIGYGNTAPVTVGGRALVYTCGFLTIILFLFLNNTAAQIWMSLVDDLFLRCKLRQFVKGPLSVVFWLAMTLVWILVTAVTMQAYRNKRSREEFPLNDAYWFSFITTTTVGFGDIHIRHEEFKAKDMFVVPLIVLIGFNFLGIFATKLVDVLNHYFPEQHGLMDILDETREEENNLQTGETGEELSEKAKGQE